MKTRLVFLSLILLATAAAAQDNPQWELFGGYQFTRFDTLSAQDQLNTATQLLGLPNVPIGSHVNMSGWNTSLQENMNSWLGGVVDFSGNYATNNVVLLQIPGTTDSLRDRIRFYTFMAGPQFTLRKSGRLQPFTRVMFGGATVKVETTALINGAPVSAALSGSETGFAMGGGGGVDFHFAHHVALRMAGDYIRPYIGGESTGQLRVSAGLAFRIGSK